MTDALRSGVAAAARRLAEAARLGCATAAQVAQGLGTDAGSYDPAVVEELLG